MVVRWAEKGLGLGLWHIVHFKLNQTCIQCICFQVLLESGSAAASDGPLGLLLADGQGRSLVGS